MQDRFEIRWNNGVYKLFDTVKYQDVPTRHKIGTRRDAKAALEQLVKA
jgi:hypothetical protein